MSKVFFTSDLHLNHDQPFIWQVRGFNSIEEMNNSIVERWNSVVSPDDIVYNLGDVYLGADIEKAIELIKRLNGTIYYAYGNHCTNRRIETLKDLPNTAAVELGYRLKLHKMTFICTHYPTLVGNTTKDNVYNLHGHTHQTTNFSEIPYCYHVGMDSHDCYPIDFEQVYAEIQEYKRNYTSAEK